MSDDDAGVPSFHDASKAVLTESADLRKSSESPAGHDLVAHKKSQPATSSPPTVLEPDADHWAPGVDIWDRYAHSGLVTRAEILGIPPRVYVEIANRDPRTVAPATIRNAGLLHLLDWISKGQPNAQLADMWIVADAPVASAVRAVLARLPIPVAHFLIETTMVVGLIESSGITAYHVPARPSRASRLIALATDDAKVIAHEMAHSWLHPAPMAPTTATVEETARRVAALDDRVAAGDAEEILAEALANERAADSAAGCWLGEIVDVGSHRERLERNIHRSVASSETRRTGCRASN